MSTEAPARIPRVGAGWNRRLLHGVVVPALSIACGFAVAAGAVLLAGADPVQAFVALFQGAFTNHNALAETLVTATPLILLGLGVALGFRAGLFNIGAEGQFYIGGLLGVYVGYSVHGLTPVIELPLTLLAGAAGGFAWAAIAGFLKARFGAHEVITTIMLNYIAFLVASYLINQGPMTAPHVSTPITADVDPNAALPIILAGSRLHAGLLVALLMVPVTWFLIERTTLGFRIRAVGLNASAARAAGIGVAATLVAAMGLSGALAGLAGVAQVIGLSRHMTDTVGAGYGFDAIAVALVARSRPFAIVPSALLFAALRSGASFMQLETQVSSDVISIVQAMVILFVAAPALVEWMLRLRRNVAPVGVTSGGLGGDPL